MKHMWMIEDNLSSARSRQFFELFL